jgi:hypothetical protein
VLRGHRGRDTVVGGAGRDRLSGGGGADRCRDRGPATVYVGCESLRSGKSASP